MSDSGGPAFPIDAFKGLGPHYGMTLRDYFAGQALAGILADGPISQTLDDRRTIAGLAYAIADAMLKAREAK